MSSKLLDLEEQDADEEERAAELDFNTPCSDSTYGTESPEARSGGAGGHPTPEDESMIRCQSMISQESDSPYVVTCTFSVSLAVPLVVPTNKPWQIIRQEVIKPREGYIPKMHRFYHMEYYLLPDDIEPRKLDMVLFGPVAKLYLESESKTETPKDNEKNRSTKPTMLNISVVKPWLENNQIWISWNHSVEIPVTNEFLIKLREHTITLRLWDLKEKVCSKARFSKQKTNLSELGDLEGTVKSMVLYQREFFEHAQPKPSVTKIKQVPKAKEKSAATAAAGCPTSAVTKQQENESKAGDQKPSRKVNVSQRKSGELACSLSTISLSGSISSSVKERTIQEAKIIKQKHNRTPSVNLSAIERPKVPNNSVQKESVHAGVFLQLSEKRKPSEKYGSISVEKKPKQALNKVDTKEALKAAAAMAAHAKKFGIAFLQLDVMPLLSDECCVACRLGEKSTKLNDAYLSFAVDKPIMSKKQKCELNPLIIRIKSAKCLPNTPVPIEELQRTCLPVYCKYVFQDMPPHQTHGRDHGTDVFFKDLNVIFAGTIEPGKLNEYLRGPPLEIEVHDRDKKMENIKIKPSLFGEEQGDNKLSDFNAVTLRFMVQNPIKGTENAWNPYGVAKIRLTDLLLGEKTLNFYEPILNCSVPETTLFQEQNSSQNAKGMDEFRDVHLPVGHYVDAQSYLKVRIEINTPLGPLKEEDDTVRCPFGCIIYLFDYKNTSLLSNLVKEVAEINAEALLLDSYPIDITQKSLNTLKLKHKLTVEEISRLDIITGFHIIDGSIHLLILEGFRNKALKRMWNKKIDRMHEMKHGRLQILYNSHLCFNQRLYINLEAMLLHVRLCKPLESIMKQSLLYIKEMVPKLCFEALSRLDVICHSKKLREVVHCNLLPSAEMIAVLSQEFGVPLTKADLLIQEYPAVLLPVGEAKKVWHVRQWTGSVLDHYNEQYILAKRELENQPPQNYIQTNIENVNYLSQMLEKKSPRTIRAFPFDEKAVFNYSCQSLNSAEIAKKLLRQEIAQLPGIKFAYNEYLSGMFDPVDEDSALKESLDQSRQLWLSSKGFVNPGYKSSKESNKHPQMPDDSRLMELREKWQENFLNTNIMKPVLDRDIWRWDKRKADFELYKKPTHSTLPPDTHREEPPKQAYCTTALKVHRCCPGTELIARGPKASCQLARLQGLLKDKPVKFSLKIPTPPVLAISDNVNKINLCKGFVPGADIHQTLKSDNIIPCYDRAHNVFKALRGSDFRLICHKRSFHYKRYPPRDSLVKNNISARSDTENTGPVASQLHNSVAEV